MAKLTALKVRALNEPGRYGDGGGLHLVVRPSGSKAWVQRIAINGKRRDMGLGGFPVISLAAARERAAKNKTAVANGHDPQAEQRELRSLPTFGRPQRSSYRLTGTGGGIPGLRRHGGRLSQNTPTA